MQKTAPTVTYLGLPLTLLLIISLQVPLLSYLSDHLRLQLSLLTPPMEASEGPEHGTLVLPGQPLRRFPGSLNPSTARNSRAERERCQPGTGTHVHEGVIQASLAGFLCLTRASASKRTSDSAAAGKGSGGQGSSIAARNTSSPVPTVIVSVSRNKPSSSNSSDGSQRAEVTLNTDSVLPAVKSIILGKVIRTTPRQAMLSILASSRQDSGPVPVPGPGGGAGADSEAAPHVFTALAPLGGQAGDAGFGLGSGRAGAGVAEKYQALVRVQDIRATQKDQVKMSESFRPGDIVRAEVISLGDQTAYYASTARNELGVVLARSDADALRGDHVGYVSRDSGDAHGTGGVAAAGGAGMVPLNWSEMLDPQTGQTEKRKVAKPLS